MNAFFLKREKITGFFSYDSLTIYDGGSSTSPMMGKYCGDSVPPSHISSSKQIMVHFETNSYNGFNKGFELTYNPTSNYRINSKSTIWNYPVDYFKYNIVFFLSSRLC